MKRTKPVKRKRAQMILDDWQIDALRARAGRAGRSISAIVRDILTKHLERERGDRRKKLERIAGIVGGGPDDAEDHDEVLYGPAGPA